MGRSSQRKGRSAELELCRILNDHGIAAAAGEPLNYGSEPDIIGLPGIHVECKRTEQLRLSEWMKQAQTDAARFGDGAPVIFWRKNRGPWMTFMLLDDWLRIYERLGGGSHGI